VSSSSQVRSIGLGARARRKRTWRPRAQDAPVPSTDPRRCIPRISATYRLRLADAVRTLNREARRQPQPHPTNASAHKRPLASSRSMVFFREQDTHELRPGSTPTLNRPVSETSSTTRSDRFVHYKPDRPDCSDDSSEGPRRRATARLHLNNYSAAALEPLGRLLRFSFPHSHPRSDVSAPFSLHALLPVAPARPLPFTLAPLCAPLRHTQTPHTTQVMVADNRAHPDLITQRNWRLRRAGPLKSETVDHAPSRSSGLCARHALFRGSGCAVNRPRPETHAGVFQAAFGKCRRMLRKWSRRCSWSQLGLLGGLAVAVVRAPVGGARLQPGAADRHAEGGGALGRGRQVG